MKIRNVMLSTAILAAMALAQPASAYTCHGYFPPGQSYTGIQVPDVEVDLDRNNNNWWETLNYWLNSEAGCSLFREQIYNFCLKNAKPFDQGGYYSNFDPVLGRYSFGDPNGTLHVPNARCVNNLKLIGDPPSGGTSSGGGSNGGGSGGTSSGGGGLVLH